MDHPGHPFPASDIAGVQPEAVRSLVQGLQGEAVVEMNVGDQGDADPSPDFAQIPGRLPVGHRNPDAFAAGGLQAANLGNRGGYIASIRLGHGLNDDGGSATHGHGADKNLSCGLAGWNRRWLQFCFPEGSSGKGILPPILENGKDFLALPKFRGRASVPESGKEKRPFPEVIPASPFLLKKYQRLEGLSRKGGGPPAFWRPLEADLA
jgi:hypothetical protein